MAKLGLTCPSRARIFDLTQQTIDLIMQTPWRLPETAIFLFSLRHYSSVVKIDRGNRGRRLDTGGKGNQFTFHQ